jgi:hypothetical protein
MYTGPPNPLLICVTALACVQIGLYGVRVKDIRFEKFLHSNYTAHGTARLLYTAFTKSADFSARRSWMIMLDAMLYVLSAPLA